MATSDFSLGEHPSGHDAPHRSPDNFDWRWPMALAVLSIIGGVVALIYPVVASFAVQAMIAAALTLVAVAELSLAVARRHEGLTTWGFHGALGLLLLTLVATLVINPFAGLVSLTVAVAILLLAVGAVRMGLAWQMRAWPRWGWLFASGLLSAVLGIMILAALPNAALWVLGVFLGIDLISSGTTLALIAWAMRDASR